jgi:CRP-like cAMP-binding protein
VVQIVGPRQSFGEAVMFLDLPCPVFAEALVDSLLLHIGSGPVFELLETDPLFARRMLAGLSMRLHSLVQDVETYSLRSSAQRVVGYLLQHCPQNDAECEGLVRYLAADLEASHCLAPQPDAGNPVAHISRSCGQWIDRGEWQADHHQQRKNACANFDL